MKGRPLSAFGLVLLVLAALAYLYLEQQGSPTAPTPATTGAHESSRDGDAVIAEAFRERRSGLWVESAGRVQRVLADDEVGSRHQRFILRLASGRTLLVSHNIDLAPRVPLAEGDEVAIRGEYEWNDRGGVVHWTHHDPQGSRDGGWIRHRGQSYR